MAVPTLEIRLLREQSAPRLYRAHAQRQRRREQLVGRKELIQAARQLCEHPRIKPPEPIRSPSAQGDGHSASSLFQASPTRPDRRAANRFNQSANSSQANPNKTKQKSLDFLGFIRPNRDFSMGYEQKK
jgi:hypothetical protein